MGLAATIAALIPHQNADSLARPTLPESHALTAVDASRQGRTEQNVFPYS